MLLSIFYRDDCFKSFFLRAVLREMSWELREHDVKSPESAEKLVLLKEKVGSGEAVITPAIQTTEAYSHEIYGILEYLNERNPGSPMYPDHPSARLFTRSVLYRSIKPIIQAWDETIETGDAAALLQLFDEQQELLEGIVKSNKTLRGSPDMPNYSEILFGVFTLAVSRHRQIQSKAIATWLKELMARQSFKDLAPEIDKLFDSSVKASSPSLTGGH